MDLDKIKMLIDAMAQSDLSEFELIEGGWTLRLSRSPRPQVSTPQGSKNFKTIAPSGAFAPVQCDAASEPRGPQVSVFAPLSGVVYLQPAPDKPPFVVPGQIISAGTPICVIEAMKVFNEIRAERDGTVDAVLVSSGAEIQAGQPLLRLIRATS